MERAANRFSLFAKRRNDETREEKKESRIKRSGELMIEQSVGIDRTSINRKRKEADRTRDTYRRYISLNHRSRRARDLEFSLDVVRLKSSRTRTEIGAQLGGKTF